METIEISLTQGKVAIVDDEDFASVAMFKWFAVRGCGDTFYACRTINLTKLDKVRVAMHRAILAADDRLMVDHVNGNGLDNRRVNLRLCVNRLNCRNRRGVANTSSRFKGVSWHRRMQKWTANIRDVDGQHWLGTFDSEEDAARSYDAAARERFGDFARLNFPEVAHATS